MLFHAVIRRGWLGLLVSLALWVGHGVGRLSAPVPIQGGAAVAEAQVVPAAPTLHYQGRLVDPSAGAPKPNGAYRLLFSLYPVASGGSELWSEVITVQVNDGLLNTELGLTTPLNISLFDGRSLWLEVTVGADPAMTPRQPISYVPYALYAKNAETVGGQPASAFASASHSHSGADIATGVVAEARIDPALARDSEVMTLVRANDGAGSSLDADLLDGIDSTAFARTSHSHSATDITSGTLSAARFSAYDDLGVENKIGPGSAQVAAGDHNHDSRYYTNSVANTRFVNADGDSMSGALAVPRLLYLTPHTHYFVLGGEGFTPGSNVDYFNTYGNGGAYIVSGTGALVASVHLPHGAVVTAFRVFFEDNSSSDMIVRLDGQSMTGGYFSLAQVTSSGVTGYGNRSTTSISSASIDNSQFSYSVYAYSTAWSSDLKIKGAVITYAIDEAP